MIFSPATAGADGVKMQTGSYTGNGRANRNIALNFTPVFFIIVIDGGYDPNQDKFIIWTGQTVDSNRISITVSENNIILHTNSTDNAAYILNVSGAKYFWIAFG